MKLDKGVAELTVKKIVELLLKDQSTFGQLEVTDDETGEVIFTLAVGILSKAKELKDAADKLQENTQEVVSGTILEDGTVKEND
jgi:hypothetical protein